MTSIDIKSFREHEAQGFITGRPHPIHDLIIWNYTPRCQFENIWDEVTTQARGLITTLDGIVVGRPFKKFFNLEQVTEPLPLEPFKVTEKMDGCFTKQTALNLWGGGTMTIGEIVDNEIPVTLIGMNDSGELVPAKVTAWHNNGVKTNWLDIEVDCLVSKAGGGGHPNKLRVTSNHHIWVNGSYQPAMDIKPGDRVITQEISPCDQVVNLIRASLLGDGCLVRTKAGSVLYQECHSEKQSEYVQWLNEKLGNCSSLGTQTISGYGSTLHWAKTKQYKTLNELYSTWYPDGVKCVPADLSWLGDFAVAKWYMDDGSLSHQESQQDRALFATNSFTFEEVTRLAKHLEQLYSVKAAVFNGKGWTIRINVGRDNAIDRFWSAIAPYIIPSLRYKLPEKYRSIAFLDSPSGHEIIRPKEVCVLTVCPVDPHPRNFTRGRNGYDVTTTTSNYLARGVLVHNSLLIVTTYQDNLIVATRGSFTSEQADKAREILRERYHDFNFIPYYTYLFEVIYKQNRIVVDYGEMEDIVLLTVVKTATGREYDIHDPTLVDIWPFPIVKYYDGIKDITQLKAMERENAEGFVVRFENGLRVKLKMAEYVRLHRLITQVNARVIWDLLRNNQPFDELLDRVPDEFYTWVATTKKNLLAQFSEIEQQCQQVLAQVIDLPTRKDQAFIIVKNKYSGVIFQMLDNKDYREAIWKWLKPQAERPFREDEV